MEVASGPRLIGVAKVMSRGLFFWFVLSLLLGGDLQVGGGTFSLGGGPFGWGGGTCSIQMMSSDSRRS
jgi:hypothetical protein